MGLHETALFGFQRVPQPGLTKFFHKVRIPTALVLKELVSFLVTPVKLLLGEGEWRSINGFHEQKLKDKGSPHDHGGIGTVGFHTWLGGHASQMLIQAAGWGQCELAWSLELG